MQSAICIMETSSKLECLPTELKIIILERLADIKTLSALVHASPAFHRVYTANRERIFTIHTLRQLNRCVRINKRPLAMWEILVFGEEMQSNLKPAIQSCCAQAHAGKAANIRLPIYQCLALRKVVQIRYWKTERPGAARFYPAEFHEHPRFRTPVPSFCVLMGRYGSKQEWELDWIEALEMVLHV